MRKKFLQVMMAAALLTSAGCSSSQFNMERAMGGAAKAVQALTITDAQMAEYVRQSVEQMD
ncbi:MAG: peptidase, partial [Muribaculaceae bacterium]|nr:peptidase [Muribaculaceae bacterium]